VRWKFIGLDKIKIVLLALSKLEQRVLWKLDIEVPFEIPDNLMIVKWMPQSEVLCTLILKKYKKKRDNQYIFSP